MGYQTGGKTKTTDNLPRFPGRLVAKPKDDSDPADVANAISDFPGGFSNHNVIEAINIHRLHLPNDDRFQEASQYLAATGLFDWVEGDPAGILTAVVPNDPKLGSQFHIPKCKFDSPADSLGAWDSTIGDASLVIAIIDSGVDLVHADLQANINAGWNFLAGNNNPQDDGCNTGHGTAVAGTAAAVTNNGVGISGCAYSSHIMPLLVTSAGCFAYWTDVANAAVWAADHGAKVINISIAGPQDSTALEVGLKYAFDAGVVIVCAAGNNGNTTPVFPARSPYCISVGATDINDVICSFSERGSAVDIYAPGLNVLTTVLGGTYGTWEGTSFASPIVAGALALCRVTNAALKPVDLKALLLNPANCDITAAGLPRLNARKLVLAASGAAPSVDTTAPVVAISSPANLATVVGTINITGTATDNVGVTKIDLIVDGLVAQTKATFPFSFDTTTLSNASHTIAAKAYDAAGNTATASISVTVNNVITSTTPPIVTITSPANGSNAVGVIKVGINATDSGNVILVTLYVDGIIVSSVSPTPATSVSTSINWNTKKVRKGDHVLKASAKDQYGNIGFSLPITVTK